MVSDIVGTQFHAHLDDESRRPHPAPLGGACSVGHPPRDLPGHRRQAGAYPSAAGQYGMLRLRTIGRRSGVERAVILGYYLDGDACVTIAMNGWAEAHPAWLYNLRANPHVVVDLVDGQREVVAREAHGDERQRLWDGFGAYEPGASLDDYATLRTTLTPLSLSSRCRRRAERYLPKIVANRRGMATNSGK